VQRARGQWGLALCLAPLLNKGQGQVCDPWQSDHAGTLEATSGDFPGAGQANLTPRTLLSESMACPPDTGACRVPQCNRLRAGGHGPLPRVSPPTKQYSLAADGAHRQKAGEEGWENPQVGTCSNHQGGTRKDKAGGG
jgi:hypothetical protein